MEINRNSFYMISFGFIQVLLISIDSIQISIDFYVFLN